MIEEKDLVGKAYKYADSKTLIYFYDHVEKDQYPHKAIVVDNIDRSQFYYVYFNEFRESGDWKMNWKPSNASHARRIIFRGILEGKVEKRD